MQRWKRDIFSGQLLLILFLPFILSHIISIVGITPLRAKKTTSHFIVKRILV